MNHSGNKLKKRLLKTVLAMLCITLAGAAWATPVNTWTYDISSQFDITQTHFNPGSGGCSVTTNSATKLAWGNRSSFFGFCYGSPNESSLVLSPDSATGVSVNTYFGGGIAPTSFWSDPGITLTHNNFTIPASAPTLHSAVLEGQITLTPNGASPNPLNFDFGINFDETSNSGHCAVGSTPCADIFVIDKDSLNQMFSYDGQNYFLSLFPLMRNGMLGVLSPDACTAAGAGIGCFGFVTKENASTPMEFGLTISTQPFVVAVPEPGALGMMGLGLLGIVGLLTLRRRRQRFV